MGDHPKARVWGFRGAGRLWCLEGCGLMDRLERHEEGV